MYSGPAFLKFVLCFIYHFKAFLNIKTTQGNLIRASVVYRKTACTLLEPPDAKQTEIILKDTNEIDEDKLRHNERLIHDWISCQNHFPKDLDKGFIRGMLRANKHILEKTKQKLEHHLAARHIYPDIYSNRSPLSKDIVQAMDVVNIAVMPKLTQKGHRLIIFGMNRVDPAEFSLQNAAKLFFLLYEFVISSDTLSAGDIAIFDANNFSAGHLAKWIGPFLKTLIVLLREAYAIRLKEMHVINAPAGIIKMVSTMKPLLHTKVRNSIYIHDNTRNILDLFGPDYLPANYGGNLKSLREMATDWYNILNENADWFGAQEHIKITGIPKRIHSKLHLQHQLGLEGSFRKLEID